MISKGQILVNNNTKVFSFSTFSTSTYWLFDIIVYLIPVSCFPVCRWWHLIILNNIFQTLAQSTALSRLYWTLLSLVFGTTAYILASSANSFISTSMTSGRSFKNIRKRTVPRTLPWGIPLVMFIQVDLEPLTIARCSLPERNSLTQPWILPRIP